MYSWNDFVKYVATASIEFPQLRTAIIAQAALESGWGSSVLFKEYGNPFGMHYHPFLADVAEGVEYDACDGKGLYAKFITPAQALKGYFAWFKHWDHYAGWESAVQKTALDWLSFIGPHYCPPGFTDAWKKAHDGHNYAQYIIYNIYPKAEQMMRSIGSKAKRVLLDPGHSEGKPGARGKTPDVQEEDLNRLQAQLLKEELNKYDIEVSIIDPHNDDLLSIGRAAKDFDAFVSLHLNATDNREHYTCAMCHHQVQSPQSKSAYVASEWAQETAKAIGNKLFSGSPNWPKGVMAAGLSVLRGATQVNCPIAFLSELEFVDDETTTTLASLKERIRLGMQAGAKVLARHV